jgi:hypothetical protein
MFIETYIRQLFFFTYSFTTNFSQFEAHNTNSITTPHRKKLATLHILQIAVTVAFARTTTSPLLPKQNISGKTEA